MHHKPKIQLKCQSVTGPAGAESVTLSTSGVERNRNNETWHGSDTPATAQLTLVITNKDAAGTFEAGKQYVISVDAVET